MVPDNHLQFNLDGHLLATLSFTYNQSFDAVCGHFSAGLNPADFSLVKPLLGKKITLSFGPWRRLCFLEEITFDAPKLLTIAGRDVVSLVVDSSAQAGAFGEGKKAGFIASALCKPFGFPVKLGPLDRVVPKFTLTPGETVFEALERVARLVGGYWQSPDGNSLNLVPLGGGGVFPVTSASQLASFQVKFDLSERFHTYTVISDGTQLYEGETTLAVSHDEQVNPLKKKTIVLTNSSAQAAKTRVLREKEARAQRSISLQAKLYGHHTVAVGSQAMVDVFGVAHTGIIKSVCYEIASGEQVEHSTMIEIGGPR